MSKNTKIAQEDVGTVVAVNSGRVKVELVRGGGCKSSSMQGICFGRNTPAVFDLESDLDLNPGDRVELEIAASTRVLTSLLVFGLTMLCLFTRFLVASHWLAALPAIAVAFGVKALSFLIMRQIDKRYGNRMQVRIRRKI